MLFVLALAPTASGAAGGKEKDTVVQLLAINDFHGPVDKTASYRVAMNNFLASGGDGFTVFNEGTDPLGGEIDLDALVNYFGHNSPGGPGPQNRITRVP